MLVLCALPFRHIDVGTANLDKLSARGEPMMGGYVEIFDCSIRQYDSEHARALSPAFLEGCHADQYRNAAAVFPEVLLLKRLKRPGHIVLL